MATEGELQGDSKAEVESKKRKRGRKNNKKAFIYGNYNSYYGYRVDRNQEEDPRLRVFKKEWFEGKDCLDIGCNQGLITISIAKKFYCQRIVGIDIDGGLIESACWNLRKVARMGQSKSKCVMTSQSQVSSNTDCSDKVASQVSNEESCNFLVDTSTFRKENLLERVSFKKENFIESLHGCSEEYDSILCLSVTKWIHLNWGDDGLIKLFVKIWRLLRPGGVFVLEPQPWSSYKRNRLVSEAARMNFNDILIHPDRFQELLLDKIGFRSVETVTNSLSGTVAGFDRPIMVFVK